MVRIILVAVILSWVALIVAVPVPVRNHLTSRDLVSHSSSTSFYPRWEEARSLDDTEINVLMQRGLKHAVKKFAAGVKSFVSKLSPSRRKAEKKLQRQEHQGSADKKPATRPLPEPTKATSPNPEEVLYDGHISGALPFEKD